MYSCRLSSHFLPVAVRNWMPSIHSFSVSSVSRTKACRCTIRLVMICLKRGSFASCSFSRTAFTRFCSVELLIGVRPCPGRSRGFLLQGFEITNQFCASLRIVLEVDHLRLGRNSDGVRQPGVEQVAVPYFSFQRFLDPVGIHEAGCGRRLAPDQSEQVRALAMLFSLFERVALAAVTHGVYLGRIQVVRSEQRHRRRQEGPKRCAIGSGLPCGNEFSHFLLQSFALK